MQLRNYQRNAIDSVYGYFDSQTGNPLVVLPTGAGKSVVIAKLCQEVLEKWENERILMLAHRKELLEQNAEKLTSIWPEAPLGIYSAGLNRRDLGQKITIAGIQSVHNKAGLLGWYSLILVDECHLIGRNGDTQYQKLITNLRAINPYIKIIGFTATPFRLDSGMLTEGKDAIFTDICYELQIADLIKAGYLVSLNSKISNIQADLSQVKIRGKEYVAHDLEVAMTEEQLVANTMEQIVNFGSDRKSWLIFCVGIKHVEMVVKQLNEKGVIAKAVTGQTPAKERAEILNDFKSGKIRAVANCDVLTTGFDAPNTDMVVMLRPTKSTGLYIQMVGRGSRLSPQTGKEDCLVLDYAGNIKEHGPITDIIIKTVRKGKQKKRELEKKTDFIVCSHCFSPNPVKTQKCVVCGAAFAHREIKHDLSPHEVDILGDRVAEWVNVNDIAYSVHKKEGAPDSLFVRYYDDANNMMYREWVCVNHSGFPRDKAIQWILRRTEVTDWTHVTLENLVKFSHNLRRPTKIKVKKAGKYWEIQDYDFTPREESADKKPGEEPGVRKELTHVDSL